MGSALLQERSGLKTGKAEVSKEKRKAFKKTQMQTDFFSGQGGGGEGEKMLLLAKFLQSQMYDSTFIKSTGNKSQ